MCGKLNCYCSKLWLYQCVCVEQDNEIHTGHSLIPPSDTTPQIKTSFNYFLLLHQGKSQGRSAEIKTLKPHSKVRPALHQDALRVNVLLEAPQARESNDKML